MSSRTYTVVTASLRCFASREFTGLTWKAAQELVASEKADGWFAWIAENECEVVENWREVAATSADRRAERAFKALRAAEGR